MVSLLLIFIPCPSCHRHLHGTGISGKIPQALGEAQGKAVWPAPCTARLLRRPHGASTVFGLDHQLIDEFLHHVGCLARSSQVLLCVSPCTGSHGQSQSDACSFQKPANQRFLRRGQRRQSREAAWASGQATPSTWPPPWTLGGFCKLIFDDILSFKISDQQSLTCIFVNISCFCENVL